MAAALGRLVAGRPVALASDTIQPPVDARGRSLFYVDRSDGLDAGEAMLWLGWAEIFYGSRGEFNRSARFEKAADRIRPLPDAGA